MRKSKRQAILSLIAIGSGFLSAVAPMSPAMAACDSPAGQNYYSFASKVKTQLPTSLMSDWIEGPATIHYHRTRSATVSAELTASTTGEANAIFASASVTLGVTVGASYTWTHEWEYEKEVPAGKDGRLRMYHDALGFTVTKHVWNPSTCRYRTAYTSKVTAPTKTGTNYWKMQLRKTT